MNEHRLAIVVKNTVREVRQKLENQILWELRELDDEDGKRPTEPTLGRMRSHAMDAVEALEALDELMSVLTNLDHVKNERRKESRRADRLETDLKDAQVEIENLQKHLEKMTTSNIALDA